MAMDNLKDFSVQWVLFGLLFFAMLAFASTFMFNNSPGALGDEGNKLDAFQTSIGDKLQAIENDTDSFLNISAQNDPEVSDLGSKDSVATSYGITGSSRSFFTEFKTFLGWILTGDVGKMLIIVFGGMFGLLALYFITKWIRQGA